MKSLSVLVFVIPSNTNAYHTSSLLKIQKLTKILPQPGVGPGEEVPDVCFQGVHNLVRIKQHWGFYNVSPDTAFVSWAHSPVPLMLEEPLNLNLLV